MRKKTHEEYLNELYLKGINFKVLDQYIGYKIKIRHQCYRGHVWHSQPANILHNSGCPECCNIIKSINKTKTDEEYVIQLLELNADLYPIEHYLNDKTKILHECEHGHQYRIRPSNVIQKLICKYCNNTSNTLKSSDSVMVYFVKFTYILDDYYKIGITSRSIEDRFGKEFVEYDMELLSAVVFDNDSSARDLERLILTKYEKYLYNIGALSKGNTETFKIDNPLILNEILSLLDNPLENSS